MSWLALAVVTSFAALLAGAVGWSVPANRVRTWARGLFIFLVVLAVVFFALTARETSALWPMPVRPERVA